jgi:zinc transporter 1
LGAFFNGVLLFGLGISILLQSIERFLSLHRELKALFFAWVVADQGSGIEDPKLVFIVGCIGLGLNLVSALFLHGECRLSNFRIETHPGLITEHGHGHGHGHSHSHEPPLTIEEGVSPISDDEDSIAKVGFLPTTHNQSTKNIQHHDHKHVDYEKSHGSISMHCHDHDHSNGHSHSHDHSHEHGLGGHDHEDLGMMGVLLHVLCDAANNLGVMAAALVIWLAKYDGRYYADPGVSMGIGLMIILSSIPLGMYQCPSWFPKLNSTHIRNTHSPESRPYPPRKRTNRGRSE